MSSMKATNISVSPLNLGAEGWYLLGIFVVAMSLVAASGSRMYVHGLGWVFRYDVLEIVGYDVGFVWYDVLGIVCWELMFIGLGFWLLGLIYIVGLRINVMD